MAEGAVSFVVEKLRDSVVKEVQFLLGVPDQIKWVETELKRIQCFLKDADAKGSKGDERVKNWVCEIRDVAYQVEDVIDTVNLLIEKRRRRWCFIRYAHFPKELITLHRVGAEIERIKNKIREIAESRATYVISNLGESGVGGSSGADDSLQARRRLFPHFDDETDHVGVEDAKRALLKQLVDGGNVRRCVISIVGMGGLGKTTLASRIYNSPDVKKHFDKLAWLSVSQDYNVIELLRGILRKVTGITKEQSEKMEEEEVRVKIYESLKGVRYLIVLDDVWTSDVWDQMHQVFPNENNGSRVILTTRHIEVAKSADPSTPPHLLRFLNDEESWDLFCKKAFPINEDGQRRYPEELEGLGRQLTKKCGGLPLALVVLGGLLSRKDRTYPVWLEVAESMDWESQNCSNILALSYHALPHHYLKSCFLYIASFPEDTRIRVSRLIRLWVAEGFIPQRQNQTMEETARGYLDELVQRSMIQVAERSLAHGWVKRIRIHDLLRDLCISEAKKDGFLNVCGSTMDFSTSSSVIAAHRVALHDTTIDKLPDSLPNLHTLLCFNQRGEFSFRPVSKFKLLRVFEQESEYYNFIKPEGIKSLIHLRYLGLRGPYEARVVHSIGNLCNLITLDLGWTDSERLQVPDALWKIRTLRNLYFDFADDVKPPTTFCLENLQMLIWVGAGKWIGRSLAKHNQLRKLGIYDIWDSHHEELLISLGKLHSLVSLYLGSVDSSIPTQVLTVFPNQHHLHVLKLNGRLSTELPTSSEFPPNLTKLILEVSQLEQDPMPTLEKLPNLVFLKLKFLAYQGKSMSCSVGGFPRLQHLRLNSLNHLEDWSVEGGAMPNLTDLRIEHCKSLTMLPEGMKQVTTLRYLWLWGNSEGLKGRVREGDGEDWYKIQHVPFISIV